MTTWMQVMALARAMAARRERDGGIDERDAHRLLTMLLAFHDEAVAPTTFLDSQEAARKARPVKGSG